MSVNNKQITDLLGLSFYQAETSVNSRSTRREHIHSGQPLHVPSMDVSSLHPDEQRH